MFFTGHLNMSSLELNRTKMLENLIEIKELFMSEFHKLGSYFESQEKPSPISTSSSSEQHETGDSSSSPPSPLANNNERAELEEKFNYMVELMYQKLSSEQRTGMYKLLDEFDARFNSILNEIQTLQKVALSFFLLDSRNQKFFNIFFSSIFNRFSQ